MSGRMPPEGSHSEALALKPLTLRAASACAQRTYCTWPPLQAHSSPSTTVARMRRAPISAIRKSNPSSTSALYTPGQGVRLGAMRHGSESGPSAAPSTRSCVTPAAASASRSARSRCRSPEAPAAPRDMPAQ